MTLVGLVLTAGFATLHLAMVDLARIALTDLAGKDPGNPRSRQVERILDDVSGHALALGIARVAFSMLTIFGTVAWLGPAFGTGELFSVPGIALAIGVAGLGLVIFGMVIPHSIAEHAGEQVIYALSTVVRVTHIACAPIRRLAGVSDEAIRRLAGASNDDSEALEAELLSVIDEGQQGGQFDETERNMIEAVVDFRTTTVEQIMTPRTDMAALAYTDDLAEVKRAVREIGHSRIPVYEENLDHVVGLLYAKDLLHYLAEHNGDSEASFELRPLLRPAAFVPESKTVRDLLTDLLAQKVHIALVADEYGGTAGLVTIEDIVEEIFGEIQDEYEQDDDEGSVDIDPEARTAEIDARTHIDDANDALEPIGVELPESDDYDTVGGFVVVTLGRIPEIGERVERENTVVTVIDAEATRVTRVRVEVVEPAPSSTDNEDRAK